MLFSGGKTRFTDSYFYVTDCDRSPNLLSRDTCYILGVLKPSYTVEKTASKTTSSPTVNASKKVMWQPNHFIIRK